MRDLADALRPYGANPDHLLSFDGTLHPEHVGFFETAQAAHDRRDNVPDAVLVAPPGRVPIFVVDARTQPVAPDSIARLRHLLALRGEAAFLAVVYPGLLRAWDVAFSSTERTSDSPQLVAKVGEADAVFACARLSLPDSPPVARGRIHDALHRLMVDGINVLVTDASRRALPLERTDAISLVGRAVFLRFLIDRGLLPEEELSAIEPGPVLPTALFEGPQRAAATCRWLDRTFNGDFLPASFPFNPDSLAERIGDTGWHALSNILHKAPGSQLSLPTSWAQLDFSRIPVGVLSEVYQHQAHHWDPEQSRKDSVFYTPGPLVAYIVEQVFDSLRARHDEGGALAPDAATFLDPAVGGGVFLVAAFRRMIQEAWRRTGERPRTAAIRRILYTQLKGFDRQATALRLTALSLYLAAVELDPEPRPLARLRFDRPLLGTVVEDVGGKDPAGLAGSLGSKVGDGHRHRYDVVLGNPPWTSAKRNPAVVREINAAVRRAAEGALAETLPKAFNLPDDNPDLAFLWRATEWCKPGGHIALLAHARLLFKQRDGAAEARNQIFSAFRVTGVLNGAALRESKVWPAGVKALFAVVYGINDRPAPNDAFHFVSLAWEPELNGRGAFRVDGEAATPVPIRLLRQKPWLLKTLFRGTRADVGLLSHVMSKGPDLESYWCDVLGLTLQQGFRVAAGSEQNDSRYLKHLPMLCKAPSTPVLAQDRLPQFNHETLHRPRPLQIYRGPLALIYKTIASATGCPRIFVADFDVAFNELFHGFSAFGHQDAGALVRYIDLLLDGPLFRWFTLLTSSQYGVERDALLLEDVKRFPVCPFDKAPLELRAALRQAAADGTALDLDNVTRRRWLSQLYDLSADDWEIIDDTLVNAPEPRARALASTPPDAKMQKSFVDRLRGALVSVWGDDVSVRFRDDDGQSPWRVLAIERGPESTGSVADDGVRGLIALADERGASQLRLRDGRRVIVALLRQRRYWTRTRARLLALDLLADEVGS